MPTEKHLRVHAPGKWVRTLCNSVVKRSDTWRATNGKVKVSECCVYCIGIALHYRYQTKQDITLGFALRLKPLTVKRLSAFMADHVGPGKKWATWPKPPPIDNDSPQVLLAKAMDEAGLIGQEIRRKYKAAQTRVETTARQCKRLQRNLKTLATRLKSAQRRHKKAIAKLAKTPVPLPEQQLCATCGSGPCQEEGDSMKKSCKHFYERDEAKALEAAS